jgi:hypothetical protein
MDPAFSSPRQAGAFALLLLSLLLLPLLVGKSFLPTREQMYAETGREIIDFPHIHDQIFEEKGDIDIAIMGSSRLGCTINGGYLQQQLSAKLGRPAVVRTLTWTWNGYDALYFVAQDLLEHRNVHTILLCDLSYDLSLSAGDIAHRQTSYWFRIADNIEALKGLPLKSQASFYASAVLGLPRNLVGLLRPNLAAIPADTTKLPWNYSTRNYTPQTTVTPAEVRVYSDATKASFHFTDQPIATMQRDFIRKIGQLARDHHTQLVFVSVPDFADRQISSINEETFWPDAFGTNVAMVGIAPSALFAGMTDDQILQLYHNPSHFNQNGSNYLTPLLTPSILQVYEDQAQP